MAHISIDREAYDKLKAGNHAGVGGDERVASFLANKFEEGEAEKHAALRDDPSWVFNVWTYHF